MSIDPQKEQSLTPCPTCGRRGLHACVVLGSQTIQEILKQAEKESRERQSEKVQRLKKELQEQIEMVRVLRVALGDYQKMLTALISLRAGGS